MLSPFFSCVFVCADVSNIPIVALVEEALPGAHCSPATARKLWQSHVQQQMRFVRGATRRTMPTAAQRKASDGLIILVLEGALLLVGRFYHGNKDFLL